MSYTLSKRSLDTLKGIHPDLVKVVKEAIKITKQDFMVVQGVRTAEEQNKLFRQGRTRPGKVVTQLDGFKKKSNHQVKDDGYGYAVDLCPYPIDWNDLDKFKVISEAMTQASRKLGVKITWGGNWKSFKDYPHYELVR